MDKRRIVVLAGFLAALGCITIYFLLNRTVVYRNEISLSRYTDKRFITLMENLINEKVFKIEGDKIFIDEEKLGRQDLNRKLSERVRKNLSQLYVKDGKIRFDHQSASISNLRDKGNLTTLRGMFLDRNGAVIAKSVLDEKTWTIKREYPQGPESYPIIGHDSIVYGKRNLEYHLNEYLAGSSHAPLYRSTSDPFRKLKIGDDIRLTMDLRLQREAYNLMKGLKGAVVVLDIKTGEILAAVSTPSFDPNTRSADAWRLAFSDIVQKPYENRAFSALYPPGSTFKTIVASAWLEENRNKKENNPEGMVCNGKKNRFGISDIYAHGKVDFESAFIRSCNQFFSEIGVSLGKELQIHAERFGFNSGIDLMPQEKNIQYAAEMSLAFAIRNPLKPKTSDVDEDNEDGLEKYREIDFRRNPKLVAQGAIGQNLITATPIQMAMVAAAVANRGMVMNPFLMKQIRDGNRKVLFEGQPVKRGRAMQINTAEEIARLMGRVMKSGTGKDVKKLYRKNGIYMTSAAKDSPVTSLFNEIGVAGKTGTAEVGDRNGNGVINSDEKPHSWFIGFAPAASPSVAIAVVAENQGFGSLTAAPIAMDVIAEALNYIQTGGK
ncbi:MAG: hypothetical protein BWK74_05290 [Desulfobacteraceae bacterium A6]|nr:MAG: hypothetical protein BWK74_05290 [Desulfobacteraceae bacterium A6]